MGEVSRIKAVSFYSDTNYEILTVIQFFVMPKNNITSVKSQYFFRNLRH
jgi:hypothetical protein